MDIKNIEKNTSNLENNLYSFLIYKRYFNFYITVTIISEKVIKISYERMLIFYFLSFILSTDIYLNASSNIDNNDECFEKYGCSINALMQYFEDTNGDTLHILSDINKPEDSYRLLAWISTKSYSEFTIIGSPSIINMNFVKSNQQYKIILNESIITFENIFFHNINSPLLSTNQGIITLKNVRFEDTQENDDNLIKIESSTCYFSNISIHKANIYHHSFFSFTETKIQIDTACIYDFNLLSSDSFLFNFNDNCQAEINKLSFIRSKSINTVIQISNSVFQMKKTCVYNANITLTNIQNSESTFDQMTISGSDFSFGRIIDSCLSLQNFQIFDSSSSKTIFESDHSVFYFTNHCYLNSTFSTIIRTNGILNSTTIFYNCSFNSIIGTASFFVFSNSYVKFINLKIIDLFIPNYCNFFNGKNTDTVINSSTFRNIYSIGQSSFVISIKDNFIKIYDSSILDIETQFLTVFLGYWEVNNCMFMNCQCYIPNSHFLMTIIEASNFKTGIISGSEFNKCKVFLSSIYCFQGENITVVNSNFSECLGSKASSVSAMKSNITIKHSNFIENNNPFPNGIVTLISSGVIFDDCNFIHLPSSPAPVLRIINPLNLIFSRVTATRYNVFAIFFHVHVPIIFSYCSFEYSFSNTFYISDFNNVFQFDNVSFPKISLTFEGEVNKSEENFEIFSKKEAKILKNENYYKTHEEYAFSETRYLEYMKNLEPLSHNSTPFRVIPYVNAFPNCDFINDIEQILNSFKKRDQALIFLSFFIMTLITIRYFLVDFLCRLIYHIISKIKSKKTENQGKQQQKQQKNEETKKKPQPKQQNKNKNQFKNQKVKNKKQS